MSNIEHEEKARRSLKLGVLTLSDSRSQDQDVSGKIICELLKGEGHLILRYDLIKEDPVLIENTLRFFISEDVDAIISNGGTGLTSRDGTIEVARKLLQKELPGFGELFRLVSYNQIGPAAMLSRATAGLVDGKILICLPGSSKGVKLAMKRLVLPQLCHMVWEAGR
ncbi:MAG: molybdenum cofactor biosynthesis protein MoaB [Candidatus Riflebacteria bacterium]|nr:molybdenum cofactor biosynthesis protein MoaB [Candidatus Riflebacteria bacterium]